MDNVHGVFVITLLEMLQLLVLIIVHHLILMIEEIRFLFLREGPINCINDSTSAAEKKTIIKFSKARTKLCLSLHYNDDESYFCLNKTSISKFKVNDGVSVYKSYLGNVSKILQEMNRVKFLYMALLMNFQLTIIQLKKKTSLIFSNI